MKENEETSKRLLKNQPIPDLKIPKVSLHHSAYHSRPTTTENLLFESNELDFQTNVFDVPTIGKNSGEIFLTSQNPALTALRNKTSQGIRGSPPISPKKNQKSLKNKPSVLIPVQRPLTSNKPLKIAALEKVRQQNELEKLTIDFKEDPVAYFSKRKDGRGHRFIYLIYSGDPENPNFSPYELKKVPFSEVNKEYYMMSATGLTHYLEDGGTETIALDVWAKESAVFRAIIKVR